MPTSSPFRNWHAWKPQRRAAACLCASLPPRSHQRPSGIWRRPRLICRCYSAARRDAAYKTSPAVDAVVTHARQYRARKRQFDDAYHRYANLHQPCHITRRPHQVNYARYCTRPSLLTAVLRTAYCTAVIPEGGVFAVIIAVRFSLPPPHISNVGRRALAGASVTCRGFGQHVINR